jgi:ADP-dependent NAD(P)H-hydrate dehydratase / NAD(P)H-hydrate epimerase
MTWRHGQRRAVRDVYGRADVAAVLPAQAAELDRAARERDNIPERVLMENAGRAAALVLDRLFPRGPVVAIAGSGHNGGDAAVVARTLLAWGRPVRIFAAGAAPPPALSHGFPLDFEDPAGLAEAAANAAVLVDGLLGTGARGAPRPPASVLIDLVNASGRPVLALDLPSGVDAGTGRVEARAIRATATVTFGWPKTGLMFHPARDYCGRLIVVEIGFPPFEPAADGARLLTPEWAAARLVPRPPDAHKGISGRLLILAGTEGMAGAAVIAARSAQRAGAGLVRMASAASNRIVLQSAVPEAIFIDRAGLDGDDLQSIRALLAGPGIGTDAGALHALEQAIALTPGRPAAFDADALNLFAREPDRLVGIARERPTVITPHPAELARLSGASIEDVTADPMRAARETASRFGCVVLLKGQPSVIASPAEPLLINTSGSSDVAAGGMGDQLSGAVGAMLAAGLEPRVAAGVALYFCGRAADLAGLGRGLSPEDVSACLPAAFADPGARSSSVRFPFVTFDQPPRW